MNFTNLSNSLSTALSLPSAQTVDGNGTGYGGKLSGTFYRFNPEFTCEGREAPVAAITASATGIQLMENKKVLCGAVNTTLLENLIDRSVYQNDIIGLNEGLFESEQTVPTSIPANLVEVWCKDTNDRTGYETITHFNRSTGEAVTRIYYSSLAGDPSMIKDFSSPRIFSQNRVNVTAGNLFSLEVRRDQPSPQIGVFNGSVRMIIDGQEIKRETLCRLGGTADPKIWPAKQIVDSNILGFKFAPNLKTFGFTSATGFNSPQLFSGPTAGGAQTRITPNLFSKGAQAIQFTPDSQTLIYWADQNTDSISELFKVNIDGSARTQLNSPLVKTGQAGQLDYKITADGSKVVYLDGHQNSFLDNEMSLNSVSINGGQTTILSPTTVAVDVGVENFAVSKSTNKVAFYYGFTTNDLYFSNLDGTGLKKININYPASHNWGIQFNVRDELFLPDPGYFAFVTSFARDGTIHFLTTAVALDESTQVQFPIDFKFRSLDPSGTKAFIFSLVQADQVKIINLMTGTLIDLPALILDSVQFNFDGSELLASEMTSTGTVQNVSINTTTGIKTIICPESTGTMASTLDLGKGRLLFTTWDEAALALTIYLNDSTSLQCRKAASIPLAKPKIMVPLISSDNSFVIMKIGNKSTTTIDHLYYLPLNGKVPMQIDSPSHTSAQIGDVIISSDLKNILFVSDQIVPNDKGLFSWKIP